MNGNIISRMRESDISQAVQIWVSQYEQYCGAAGSFPTGWVKDPNAIVNFLKKKVADKAAIVARSDDREDRLLGYLAYDEFPFNGEKTVFCPAIAHGATGERREETYRSLYEYGSREWVSKGVLNHMWTIFYNDGQLKGLLYDLGFGSHLIDAFALTSKEIAVTGPDCNITKAGPQDAEVLCGLVEESREYYRSAPLFLVRDRYMRDDILEILGRGNVFLAWEGEEAIGFIYVSVSERNNVIDLSDKRCGLLDEIGAYIKPGHRSRGLGKRLLQHTFNFCASNGIDRVHVDFETANPFANRFWPKHFDPMLLSVRRPINRNINDPVV